MRTTRRLLEPRTRALPILAGLVGTGLVVATASCSSTGDPLMTLDGGGAVDGVDGMANDGAAPEDGDVVDAGPKDAAVVDAAPLPIRCEAPPCAVALSTTVRGSDSSREEGYCALLDDGTVACWGANNAGQLGDGEGRPIDGPVPARVPGLSNVTSIDHTCAVTAEGDVWCWGRGPFVATDAGVPDVVRDPVRIALPAPASKVALGSPAACALLRDETVVCWGSNYRRQIADELPATQAPYYPARAANLPAGVKSIVSGYSMFAIYGDGKVFSWGNNPALGRATPFNPDGWPTPITLERVSMIDTIDNEACAVADGIGWCWGAAIPVAWGAVADPYARVLPAAVDIPEPITRIATTRTWTGTDDNVSFVDMHRWCATSISGEVYCWGLNNAGQAGDGTKEYALAVVHVAGLPAPAAEVKIMPYSTCAVLTNGKVYCWGSNMNGQLGAGLPKGSTVVPVEVKLP